MDSIYFFPFAALVGMIVSGFIVSSQLRLPRNNPLFIMLFVRNKLAYSFLMGLLVSVLMAGPILLRGESSEVSLLVTISVLLFAAAGWYYGISSGLKQFQSMENVPPSADSGRSIPATDNVIVEDSLTSIKITATYQKRWAFFVFSMVQLAIFGLFIFPILGFFMIGFLQRYLPDILNIPIFIAVGGLLLYVLYSRFREDLEYIFDKEIVEIDNQAVEIQRSGSGFSRRQEFPAENIRKITTMPYWIGPVTGGSRLPFMNTNMPAFMIWHESVIKRYRSFGRGIDPANAQRVLEAIYARFPQYKG